MPLFRRQAISARPAGNLSEIGAVAQMRRDTLLDAVNTDGRARRSTSLHDRGSGYRNVPALAIGYLRHVEHFLDIRGAAKGGLLRLAGAD